MFRCRSSPGGRSATNDDIASAAEPSPYADSRPSSRRSRACPTVRTRAMMLRRFAGSATRAIGGAASSPDRQPELSRSASEQAGTGASDPSTTLQMLSCMRSSRF